MANAGNKNATTRGADENVETGNFVLRSPFVGIASAGDRASCTGVVAAAANVAEITRKYRRCDCHGNKVYHRACF